MTNATAAIPVVELKPKPRHKPAKVRGVTEITPGQWEIRFTDAAGTRRRERAGTRQGAIDLLRKRKAEARDGVKLAPKLHKRGVLFSELVGDAEVYALEHHSLTRRCDFRAPRARKMLGELAADSITPAQIDAALNRMAAERDWQNGTRNRMQAFISLAFRLGVDNGKVAANPARLVHRKRESAGRIRWLTTEEETRLVAVIEASYPFELAAFLLSVNTGMRRSEQYRRIQWQDVDLEQRRLWIPGSKNGSPRSVPLNDAAIRALLALRDRGDGTGQVMRAGKGGHGLLAGAPQKTPREWFENACKKAGLNDYTWHCNRHTFASRLAMAGVPLRTIQELMGHKTIAMTCRYSHLAPKHMLDAVMKLDHWQEAGKAAVPNGLQIGQTAESGQSESQGVAAQVVAVQ